MNWTRRMVVTAAAVLLAGVSLQSHAQDLDRLNPSIISSTTRWTPEQQEEAKAFVVRQKNFFLTDQEAQVTAARDNLRRPFDTVGNTRQFREQYSELIAAEIGPLVKNQSLRIRMNVMIVFELLSHTDALAPILLGLDDSNPGVRYSAAKAVANVLRTAKITDRVQRGALDRLEEQIDREEDVFVVTPLLKSLLDVSGPTRVLKALNKRVDWHIARADQTYDPERKALFDVYYRFAAQTGVNPADVKELARAAARYYLICARQLDDGKVPSDSERSHLDMIRFAQTALVYAYSELGVVGNHPKEPNAPINIRNWGEILKLANEWINVLKAPPFNFPDDQLEIQEAG